MAVEKINIEKFLELAEQLPVIDVRSPGEYDHAHIPSAYSLPLFTNEERAVVGTAYKQQSREIAIKHGLDFFGPKMKKIVEEAEVLTGIRNKELGIGKAGDLKSQLPIPNSKTILVYCWRGGMRSGAIAWLLDVYGFKVYTLIGGYKKFRTYVLDGFKKPYQFNILGGFTGSGKTEVLKELKRSGEIVIDLENLANHKGSAFGNIGMPKQPTQEMFENLLCFEMRTLGNDYSKAVDPSIWLEDESQRIGLVNIPGSLWQTMRQSPVYFLNIPFEERLNHIAEEYGKLEKEKMIEAIGRIKERLGGLEAKKATEFLEQDNTIESFRILLKYYDKWYAKGLHNREALNSLLHTITCETVTPENAKKLIQQPVYHEKP